MNIVNSGRILLRNASDLLGSHHIGKQAFSALKHSVNFLAKQIIHTGALFQLPHPSLTSIKNTLNQLPENIASSIGTQNIDEQEEFSLEVLRNMNRSTVDMSNPEALEHADQQLKSAHQQQTAKEKRPDAIEEIDESLNLHNTLVNNLRDLKEQPLDSHHSTFEQEKTTAKTFQKTLTELNITELHHLCFDENKEGKERLQTIKDTIEHIGKQLPHISTPLERTRLLNQIHKLSLKNGLPPELKQTLQQINQQKGQLPLATFLNKPVPPLNE